MSTPEQPQLPTLIKLLADDHPPVVEAARAKLIEMGVTIVPFLKQSADSHEDPKVRTEIRNILERIRLDGVSVEWGQMAGIPEEKIHLESASFLVAKVYYPDMDIAPYRRQLDELAHKVRPRLAAALPGKEQLMILNQVLFREEGFHGNWDNYFDPQNSYLNRVMDRKLGIPISLSILYLLVGQRLGLPLKGVAIPGHFMVKYESPKESFFVDPFNEGRFLTRGECIQFIVEAGYPYQAEFLDGVGPREILARMLRNLILIYLDRREKILEKVLNGFLSVLYPEEDEEEDFEEDPDNPGGTG